MPAAVGHPAYSTDFLQGWIKDAMANVMPEGLVELDLAASERRGSDPGSLRGKVLYKLAVLPDIKSMASFFQGWSAQGPAYVMGSAVKYKTEKLGLSVNGPVLVPEMLKEKADAGRSFTASHGITDKHCSIDHKTVDFGNLDKLREYACPNGPLDVWETDPNAGAPDDWWHGLVKACSPYIIVTPPSTEAFEEPVNHIIEAAKKGDSPYEVVGTNLIAAIGHFRSDHPDDPVNAKGTWKDYPVDHDRRFSVFNLRPECRETNAADWKAMKPCEWKKRR